MLDLVNERFGRLVVLRRTEVKYGSGERSRWVCLCDCGETILVPTDRLRLGKTRSCGCLFIERLAVMHEGNRTHGMSRESEYRIWVQMKNRCDPEIGLEKYGKRGIRVCQRWMDSFENFYEDMGPRPSPLHSIDREDNDGNYEPGNCRWATKIEQSNNRGCNVVYTVDGVNMTQAEAARHAGIHVETLRSRLRRGATVEEALKRPIQPKMFQLHITDSR